MNEHIQTRIDEIVAQYDGDVTHWDAQNEIGKLITSFRDVPQHQFQQILIASLSQHMREKRNNAVIDSGLDHSGSDL